MNKKATIQLLRNSQIYNTKEAAITGLESCANLVEDGAPLVARYKKTGNEIGAILGIKNTINNGSQNVTKVVIFDNIDDSGTDMATAIQNAIDALDMNSAAGGTGKMITTINQTDGVVSATAIDAKASNIAINTTDFPSSNVENALTTLYSRSNITVDESSGTGDILKTYTIKQNGTALGTINIPKDLVVQSGSVVTGETSGSDVVDNSGSTAIVIPSGVAGHKYLKLVIANQTTPIYIDTNDFVDIYTEGNGIDISNSNAISIQIDNSSENFLSVGSGGLKLSGVQNAIDTAAAGRLTNIKVNNVTGTVSSGVSSLTLKTNNINLNEGVSSGTFGALTTSDTITSALGKLYGGIVANQTNITKNTVSNSDSSITVTPGNSSTDIKVNIVDCGTYTI